MKKLFLLGLIISTCCLSYDTFSQVPDTARFKMIIRLWPHHHTDSLLRSQLYQALKKYRPACDEVWFCMEDDPYVPMERHKHSSVAMASMSKELSKLGITSSIQGITLGHSDSFGLDGDRVNLVSSPWGKMVNSDGTKTYSCNCPRQQAFLDYISEAYAIYAKAVHPAIIWLDDDLRITHHSPAEHACFCDTCIAQFNSQTNRHLTRESLVAALDRNDENGFLRLQWIRFSQESLAGVAAAISRSVHAVSPSTRMGLQHANFHRELLEGYDWNLIYDAMENETGLVPASRPGNGFYNDYAPREMLIKAYDMARQIRRLKPEIRQIAPEIEGWHHCATGVSPQGLCVESQLFLAMGTTQLSYAILCSADEPMEWYAEHYLKNLADWRSYYEDYANFNLGTEPGGLDSYISPDMVARNEGDSEKSFSWSTSIAGNMIYNLSTLGIPFTPDGHFPSAYILDKYSLQGLSDGEMNRLSSKGVLLDQESWSYIQKKGFDKYYRKIDAPTGIKNVACYLSPKGGRLAVIPTFSTNNVNIQRRHELLQIADWISQGKLPVIIESMAQMVAVPRIDGVGNLRSLTLLNCSISEQEPVVVRLRGCSDKKLFLWKQAKKPDIILKSKREGTDMLLTVPAMDGWNIGWIAVK